MAEEGGNILLEIVQKSTNCSEIHTVSTVDTVLITR